MWPGGLFELPDGNFLDLPAGTYVEPDGDSLYMRTPDGTELFVQPPEPEGDASYVVEGWLTEERAAELGRPRGPGTYFIMEADESWDRAVAESQADDSLTFSIPFSFPVGPWPFPALVARSDRSDHPPIMSDADVTTRAENPAP